MEEELKRIEVSASELRNAILDGRNVDILLYLAKYNPDVSIEDIRKRFGDDSVNGLKMLEKFNLVNEKENMLTLTDTGIFQVDNLLKMSSF